jgi:LPXTG-site transpeptidase (sortase) family protein
MFLDRLPVSSRRLFVIGAPVLALVVLGVVFAFVVVFGGSGGSQEQASSKVTPTAESLGLLTPQISAPVQSADLTSRSSNNGLSNTNPDAPKPGGSGDHLIIPSIGVDAPMTSALVTVNDSGAAVLPNPSGPTDVVWYDFSNFPGMGGRPGGGGNTVVSGHVDYHNYGPAVFWDLSKLNPGDEIDITLTDGSTFKYSVQWNKTVEPDSTAWNDIVASTTQESLTMITCAGTFDPSSRSYDQRRIVWAVRTQ